MSLVLEARKLEDEIAKLQGRLAEIGPEVQDRIDFLDGIKKGCQERGYSLKEIAVELCPELNRKSFAAADRMDGNRTRAPRMVKRYKNPHTGEVIETKGGNHKGLKQWKDQYGADEVQNWLQ